MADTITSIIVQIRADTAAAAAELKNFVTQNVSGLTLMEKQGAAAGDEIAGIGEAAKKTGVHLAGMSYYARSGIDGIRAAFAGGGDRAIFYALDEGFRGLLASGLALGTLLPVVGVIGAAVGAGVGVWNLYTSAEREAAKQAEETAAALQRIPDTLKQIREASQAGLIGPGAEKFLSTLLTGELSYKINLPITQALQQGRITQAAYDKLWAANAALDAKLHPNAPTADIFGMSEHEAATVEVEATLAERAKMVNDALVKRGYLMAEIDDKTKKPTGKFVTTVEGQALLDEMELQNRAHLNALDGVERERAAAKQKFDDEMAQYKQLSEIANAATPGGPSQAQRDLKSRLPQLLADIQAQYQTALSKIDKSESDRMAREQAESATKIKTDDAQDATEQIKKLEDSITSNQLKAGADRNSNYQDEYNQRIFLYRQLLYSGEITEAEYTDKVTAAAKLRTEGEKEYNTELQRSSELKQDALRGQLDAILRNPFATDQDKARQSIPVLEKQLALQKEMDLRKGILGVTIQQSEIESKIAAAKGQNSVIDNLKAQYASFMSSVQNTAGDLANFAMSPFAGMKQGLSSAIDTLLEKGMTAKQFFRSIALSIGQSMIGAFSQMVANWIMSHIVMRGVSLAWHAFTMALRTGETAHSAAMTGVEVSTHAAGEATKTSTTGVHAILRGAIRIGEAVFHGILIAVQVAAHIAGELTKTAATVAQALIRGLVYVMVAAVAAMEAMAGIPYIGPFLAVAAAAGMVALGMALLGGFEEGGYTGDGPVNQIAGVVHRGEYVIPASRVRQHLPLLQAIHSGSLADMMAPSARIVSSPVAQAGGGSGQSSAPIIIKPIIVHDAKAAALEAMASPAGEKVHIMHTNKNRGKVGIQT